MKSQRKPWFRRLPGRGRRKAEEGLTLVDLMGGMVIAMLVLGGILTTVASTAKLRRVDDELGLAFMAARTRLEEVRNAPFSSVATMDGTRFDVNVAGRAAGELKAPAGTPGGLPGRLEVQEFNSSGSEVIHRVRATVTWDGVSGIRTFSMETLVTNRRS